MLREPSDTPPHAATVKINVFTQVGGFCVAVDDGEKVFHLVKRALDAGKTVELSFEGVESISSAFLNSAIGQLVGLFDAETLRARLQITELSTDDRAMLRRVIENARRYFTNPERFKAAQREVRARA